jgi:hypothetical protein
MGQGGKLNPTRINFTPIRADSGVMVPASCGALLWRLGDALGLSVAIKSTFSLERSPMGTTTTEPIHCVDLMHPTRGLVIAPNDLVPRKAKVDIVAWGRAVRPKDGSEARAITVGLELTQVAHKAIERSYTRAVGEPSGFGAAGFSAPSRQALLRDLELVEGGDGALVIPSSLNPEFFQSAPPPQQIDALARDATITLVGMHPARQTVTAQLPSAMAEGVVFGVAKKDSATPLTFRADTLVIDADRMICSVVWRAEIALFAVAQLPGMLITAGVSTAEHRITLPVTRPDAPSSKRSLDATVMFGDAFPAAGEAPPTSESPFESTAVVSADAITSGELPFESASSQPKKSPLSPAAHAWAEKLGDSAPKGGTAIGNSDSAKGAALPFGAAPPFGKMASSKGVKSSKSGAGRMAAWAKAVEAGGNKTKQVSSKVGSDTLPFGKSKTATRAPKPAAEAWVEATGKAKGGTAVVFGSEQEGNTLPFGEDLTAQRDAALREQSRTEAEAKRAADDARDAEIEAEERRKEAEEAREREHAEKRRAEEKARFDEEQKRLAEMEAKRKREARLKAEKDAADLEDDLYGGFGKS